MIALTGIPTLTTDRLRLRGFQPADWPAFSEYFGSDRAVFTGGPMLPKTAWRHFATNIGHWAVHGFGMFVVTHRDDDAPLGIVGHWYPHGWAEREVGWVLFDKDSEGKGIAREAAEVCVAHAYQSLGWDTVVSYIAAENAASIRLAERLGATLDEAAPQPDTTAPCLVYRHPRRS